MPNNRGPDENKAVVFVTGGKSPDKERDHNWIGRVGLCLENESVPFDVDGREMVPLAMFSRSDLPWMPESVNEIEVLTVFLSSGFWNHLGDDDYRGLFRIREYGSAAKLVQCDWNSDFVKPFPLTASLIGDCEDGDEGNGDKARFGHKLGGFPTFIQGQVWYGEEYDFVFQIASDGKAELNIVDGGCFYFFRNRHTGEWKMHCDFF